MRSKLRVGALALAISASAPNVHATGIPVVDAAAITQAVLQVQYMLDQIGELQAQYQLATDQLDSMSDARGLANVINSGYDAVLDGDADSILQEYDLPTSADLGLTGSSASLYDMSGDSAAFLSRTRNALDQAKDRFSDLTGLINKVNGSPDQKDILDLQARIGAEETMLQNEQAKLLMMQAEAQAMAQMREEKVRQMLVESAGTMPTFGQ